MWTKRSAVQDLENGSNDDLIEEVYLYITSSTYSSTIIPRHVLLDSI